MLFLESIKSFFKFDLNACRKRLAFGDLEDLNRQIKQEYEYIRELEQRRNRAEALAFMELRG